MIPRTAPRLPLPLLVLATLVTLCSLLATPRRATAQPPGLEKEVATTRHLKLPGGDLQVDFAPGSLDLPIDTILAHIQAAASAVATYYGRFPVAHARLLIVPVPDKSGILQGTTWPGMHGVQSFTRIRLGQHTTTADLSEDWTTTHELVHLAFPSLPDEQHWMEEGLATYVEPIARVQTGELKPTQIWRDMVRGMPKGEPADGDQGIDRTHTWGRTYWGGALFCLVADVTIRRETANRKGLQDALRAIVAQDGAIDHNWPLPRALETGDRATGTHVLTRMYAEWKEKPIQIDLPKLWNELGIRWPNGTVEFTAAPDAHIRDAITLRMQ